MFVMALDIGSGSDPKAPKDSDLMVSVAHGLKVLGPRTMILGPISVNFRSHFCKV